MRPRASDGCDTRNMLGAELHLFTEKTVVFSAPPITRTPCLAFLCLVQRSSRRLMLIIQVDAWARRYPTDSARRQRFFLQGHAKTVHAPMVGYMDDLFKPGGNFTFLRQPFRCLPPPSSSSPYGLARVNSIRIPFLISSPCPFNRSNNEGVLHSLILDLSTPGAGIGISFRNIARHGDELVTECGQRRSARLHTHFRIDCISTLVYAGGFASKGRL